MLDLFTKVNYIGNFVEILLLLLLMFLWCFLASNIPEDFTNSTL